MRRKKIDWPHQRNNKLVILREPCEHWLLEVQGFWFRSGVKLIPRNRSPELGMVVVGDKLPQELVSLTFGPL